MAIFTSVQAGMALAVAVAGGVAALLTVWAWRGLRRPQVQRPAELSALAESLGLLSVTLDAAGLVVDAARPLRTLGAVPGALAEVVLGADVGVLRRGAARSPTAARIEVPARGPAHAVVVRACRRPVRDVVLIEALWEEHRPPPLPPPPRLAAAAGAPAPPPWQPPERERERVCARATQAAVARSVLPPVERAATAAALLRLALPDGAHAAVRELERVERGLAESERRLRALAGQNRVDRADQVDRAGRAGAVDLAALVGSVLGGLPSRVQPELVSAPAVIEGDALRVRVALREVLASVLGGGEGKVVVRVAAGEGDGEEEGDGPVLELSTAGGVGEEAVALAQALLGPEGSRVALVAGPGAARCRITFPRAAGPCAEPAARERRL